MIGPTVAHYRITAKLGHARMDEVHQRIARICSSGPLPIGVPTASIREREPSDSTSP
jgi:hypothetical protein